MFAKRYDSMYIGTAEHILQNVYLKLGKLELGFLEGGHRWAENKTFDFFKKYL